MAIEPELLAYLGGPSTADLHDIAGSRERERSLVAERIASRPALPAGMLVEDRVARDRADTRVPVRVYARGASPRPRGALLFIHGGAFVFGDLEQDHERCLHYATNADVVVVAVDYRLAPEHPYPAGLDDVRAVLHWMCEHAEDLGVDPSRIAVGGASAGGALAAGLTLRNLVEGGPALAAQLLLYPALDDRATTRSMSTFAEYDPWDGQRSRQMWPIYLGHPGDAPPYAAPARASDLSGCPTTFIMTCEEDPLRDEELVFAQRLLDAGVSVELHHYRGTYHAFDVIAPDTAISQRALEEQTLFLDRVLTRRSTP